MIRNSRPIAPSGQYVSHRSQKVQSLGRTMTARPADSSTARAGQSATQRPQPLHRLRSMRGSGQVSSIARSSACWLPGIRIADRDRVPWQAVRSCDISHKRQQVAESSPAGAGDNRWEARYNAKHQAGRDCFWRVSWSAVSDYGVDGSADAARSARPLTPLPANQRGSSERRGARYIPRRIRPVISTAGRLPVSENAWLRANN